MNLPKKTFYLGVALLAILASIALLLYLGGFQRIFLKGNLLSGASPIGVLAVIGILVFGGVYLFNAAGKIIKENLK